MIQHVYSPARVTPAKLAKAPRTVKHGRRPSDAQIANLVPGASLKRLIPNPSKHRAHPTNWSNKHNLLLYMHVAGQTNKVIAAALGYHPDRVGKIISSPLFQSQKEQLLADLRGQTLESLVDAIRQDAPKNLHALVELRDDFQYHGGDPKIRLGAMRQLSREQDRVWPRRTEHTEERTIRLVFDQHTIARMAQALGDARGIDIMDADFQEIAETTELAELVNPKGVDELIHELAERAREESASG